MSNSSLTQSLKGVGKIVDILGWQKWFGAAVLGFAWALCPGSDFLPLQLQGLAIGVSMILCYNQSVNDCFDVEIDEIKERVMGKKLIISDTVSRRTALATTLFLLLTGLASAGIASTNLFVIAAAMALLGTLYSVPPFRLKMKYPFSTLIQFVGCFLPFLAGVASIRNLTLQAVIVSSAFAFLAMVHRFVHEIQNYKADLLSGKRTVAVVNGTRTAEILGKSLALLGIVEFAVFFVLGWLPTVFLFLFVLYLIIAIFPWSWLLHMPRQLQRGLSPIIKVSGFILLIIVLLLCRSA